MNERREDRDDDRDSQNINLTVHLDLRGLEGIVAALADRPALQQIVSLLMELKQMSATQNQTVDAAFADISARLDKFSTDLAADLANITSGPLNATQQAAADSIKAKIDTMESTVLPAAPPATP